MTGTPLLLYAIWSDAPDADLLKGLRLIHEETTALYNLLPEATFAFDDAHLHIGSGFFLFLAEAHWSPGDISGCLSNERVIPNRPSVMAVLVDTERSYLPYQGLPVGFSARLNAIYSFQSRHRLVRRSE